MNRETSTPHHLTDNDADDDAGDLAPDLAADLTADIVVRAPMDGHLGTLTWHNQGRSIEINCAIGAAGLSHEKREGDGSTPLGRFALRQIWFRPDRLRLPETALPQRALTPNDGWSDDPEDPKYNQAVHLPHPFNHEILWRDDHLYDVLIEIGYNDAPARAGLGSAIFLHLQKNNYQATRGCVAINLDDMLTLIPTLRVGSQIQITRDQLSQAS